MDNVTPQGLQPRGTVAKTSASTRKSIPWRQRHSGWRLKQMLSGFCTCLMAVSVFFMAGCSDDEEDRRNVNARVSDSKAVFRVFGAPGTGSFVFPGGMFGPGAGSASSTTLSFSNVQVTDTAATADFRTDPQNVSEADGEGDSDGADSCGYTYQNAQGAVIKPRIDCKLCDLVITATEVPCGGTGRGRLVLQLDDFDTTATRQNPALTSNAIDVTVGLDSNCNVVTVNGVRVVEER